MGYNGTCDREVVLLSACETQCDIGGFHSIDVFSLKLFRQMGLNIHIRAQATLPALKNCRVLRRPSVRTAGLSAANSGKETKEAVVRWCMMPPGYAVVIGRCRDLPSMQALLYICRLDLTRVFF